MRDGGLLLWAMVPVLPFLVVGRPVDGLGVAWDLLWIALLASWWVGRRLPAVERPGWLISLALGGLWALVLTYSLALAGSRAATDEQLPLYDLTLLVRPLVVVAADLYGAVIYAVALGAALLPLVFVVLGAAGARGVLPVRRPAVWVGVAALLVLAPGSRALTWDLGADAVRSWRLAAAFDAERAARPHDDLQRLELSADPARRPDVHVYVVESYGTVVRRLQGAKLWEQSLERLQEEAKDQGWSTAAGVSTAPVHGGRSWISDTSVLTGLHVATQSNYERATAMADRIPTLPRFFQDRGYTTILVRPSDRARPGVKLQNRFHFQRTVFFDDLEYTGPAMGWGHIPDQYTLYVAHRDVIDPLPGPTFAFFHLATSHMPWFLRPKRLDDPLAILDQEGKREQILKIRKAGQELRMQAKRFTSDDGLKKTIDRTKEQGNYVASVIYDIESVVQQVGGPDGARPRLVVFYGDHQPPFLARGEPPTVPVHVMASDPAMLEPFLEAGFRPGLLPQRYTPVVEHRDLFPLIARAAAASR